MAITKRGGAVGRLSPQAVKGFLHDPMLSDKTIGQFDVSALMKLMWDTWNARRDTHGFESE